MRQAASKVFLSVAFLLLLSLAAQGQYQRPKPDNGGQPTAADLEIFDGASQSVTVQLLNLTPYDIQFDHLPGVTWSITSTDEQVQMVDRDRMTQKSFMFVPVGIPSLIPAAPDKDFLKSGDPGYDSNYVDETTHPYAMVFSWDDRGGFVVDNWVKWTIKAVKYTTCDESDPITPVCKYEHQDVDLGLWMYRNKPTHELGAKYLPILVDSLKVTFKLLSLPIKAESPLAWANAFLAIATLANEAKNFNTQANDGNKMWVASYVIPHPDSVCGKTGLHCTPSIMTPAETGDAVYSLWPAEYAGPSPNGTTGPGFAAEAQLVVTVHVFRGEKAKQCDPAYYPNKCPLGSESVVMITVMKATDFSAGTMVGAAPDVPSRDKTPPQGVRLFLLQAGAGRIRQLVEKQGRPGLLVLRSIIEELNPAQTRVLMEMVRTMGSGRLPTQQERQLVQLIAAELKARLK